MQREVERLDNGDGWRLDVKRYHTPGRLDADRPPIVIFPGYCMNTSILAFHPRGTSLVQYLCGAGFEVWTANLRGQGDAEALRGAGKVGFSEIASIDIPRVIGHVHEATRSRRREPHAFGCSLGGTFLYAYLALHWDRPGLSSMVGLGAPLRWVERHPLLRVAFRSPRLVSMVKVSGTRRLARIALPVAKRVPGLLSMYMNTEHIDLSDATRLTETIDDPHTELNVQIVRWLRAKDLMVRGLNVTEALRRVDVPLLAVHANGDGIVPPAVARSAVEAHGGPAESLEAGDDEVWFAHADMFINDHAEDAVFAPVVRWLQAR